MKLIKALFTAFVIVMIVLPVPPTTIIGVALATNPKTGKYMDQRAYAAVQAAMRALGLSIRAMLLHQMMSVSEHFHYRHEPVRWALIQE